MPRCLTAVAAALMVLTLPACAQRGGAHPGSVPHFSGFTVQSFPAFHGGFAASGRPGFSAPSQFSGSHYVAGNEYANRRPGNGGGYRYRRPYTPVYGLGLPYYGLGYSVGYIPDYLDYSDSASYASPGYAPAQPQPSDYYGPPPPSPQYPADPAAQADVAPAPSYRPSYQRPQPAPEPAPGLPVTLVFRDGRPNEQIQNYMLTRTTLYVQEQRLRMIPVDQLDLTAMNKINGDAGVEFILPGSPQ